MLEYFKKLGRSSFDIAWILVILLLPITSFPILSHLVGNSMVAPASFIPLAWVPLWFIYHLFNRGSLPRETIIFLLFISITFIASALALFMDIPPFRGEMVIVEEIKAILTLAIGSAFYLITSAWFYKYPEKLTVTLKVINLTGMAILLWALAQGFFIYFMDGKFPSIFNRFQSLVSTQLLNTDRMTGFAFEPSWLAHQLNLLFIPYWLAATTKQFSAFRVRFYIFSLENILLGVAVPVLFLASRIGTLSFLTILAFLIINFSGTLTNIIQKKIIKRIKNIKLSMMKYVRPLMRIIIILSLLGIFTLVIIIIVFALSHVDWRLERFFQVSSLEQFKKITRNPYILFNYLSFAERYVYWVAGWKVFNLHPIYGVGLGNAGFFFQSTLPYYGWSLPEVLRTVYHTASIPNIKNLWVRLLAETGIIGFSTYIVWNYVILRSAWILKHLASRIWSTVGWFGIYVLLASISEGFSTDTFALPYIWISLGLVSGIAANARKGNFSIDKP